MMVLLIGAIGGYVLAKAQGLNRPAPDSVDIGFLQDMSIHHEQAVDMATRARSASADPGVRRLAFDIETGQIAQIGRMQGWLELWQAPVQPISRAYMSWMDQGGGHQGSGHGVSMEAMPGMASSEELGRLRTATGAQLDVLFLQLMKRHHEGALPMLRYASQRATRPEVRNLATQMLRAQSSEVELLRELLAERG